MDINGYHWISMIFLSEIWWLPILIFDNKRITVFLPVYTWVPNLMLPPYLLSMTSMIDETEIKPNGHWYLKKRYRTFLRQCCARMWPYIHRYIDLRLDSSSHSTTNKNPMNHGCINLSRDLDPWVIIGLFFFTTILCGQWSSISFDYQRLIVGYIVV